MRGMKTTETGQILQQQSENSSSVTSDQTGVFIQYIIIHNQPKANTTGERKTLGDAVLLHLDH